MLNKYKDENALVGGLCESLRSVQRELARLGSTVPPFDVCMVHTPRALLWDKKGYDHDEWPSAFPTGSIVKVVSVGRRPRYLRAQRRFRLACLPSTARRFVALCDDVGNLLKDTPPFFLSSHLPIVLANSIRARLDGRFRFCFPSHWLSTLFHFAMNRKKGSLLHANGPFVWESVNGKEITIYYKEHREDLRCAVIISNAVLASERAVSELLYLLEVRLASAPVLTPAVLRIEPACTARPAPVIAEQDAPETVTTHTKSKKPFTDTDIEATVLHWEQYKKDCRASKRRYRVEEFAAINNFCPDKVRSHIDAKRNRVKRCKIKKLLAETKPPASRRKLGRDK